MPYSNNGNAHPIIYGTTSLNHKPYLNISGAAYPSGKITANQSFELKGNITSNETITSVYASIYYLKDNTLVPKFTFSTNVNPAMISPNKTSAEIYNTAVNTGLKFGELPEEAYRYELCAVTSSGYSKTLVDSTFTVGSFVLSTGVVMNQSALSIGIGSTATLTGAISPSSATKKTLSWYSNDPGIARVDSNGKVTGVSVGTTNIIAETIDGSNASTYCTVQVSQNSGTWGSLSRTINDSGILTISGKGAMDSFELWDENSAWRPYISTINEVIIQSGITSIGDYAFGGCSMTSVSMPESVTGIGFSAFYNCPKLTGITIPKGVTNIGNWAFSTCTSLMCAEIPAGVSEIGENAFSYCSKLYAIKIPSSVKSIGDNAFEDDNNLSVYCYEGSEAEKYASDNGTTCYFLDTPQTKPSFILPANLKTIGTETFAGSKAKCIRLKDKAETIGSKAFYNCPNLIQIYIPANCTDIASDAFANSDGLTIFGEDGSYAETYARGKGIVFASSDLISQRIKEYITDSSPVYAAILDLNRDGNINSSDYILAKKTGL